jgi:hypothetical protein
VLGNRIGVDVDGRSLGNGIGVGVFRDFGSIIGRGGAGNLIAFNGTGVVSRGREFGANFSLGGNSIHSNLELGIDLVLPDSTALTDGVTLNDPGDRDGLTNFPSLTGATVTIADAALTTGETATCAKGPDPLLFVRIVPGVTPDDPPTWQPVREFRKSWATACKMAGVEALRFHDLRRTAVRNMVRAGVSQTVAMAISGHKTDAVFRRYDITSDDDLRQAMERTAAYVETLPGTVTRLER